MESSLLSVQGTEAQRGEPRSEPAQALSQDSSGSFSGPGNLSQGEGLLVVGHHPPWASVSPSVNRDTQAMRVLSVWCVLGEPWRPRESPSLFRNCFGSREAKGLWKQKGG